MTDSREQFRKRSIDYLYGELEGAELADFEAQLAASESYRDELAALQRTLKTSRAGLAMLEESPPAHISRELNAFAKAHAASTQRTAGDWLASAWLRKPIWIGAVGVSAVVALALIARPPKNPERERSSELPNASPAARDEAAPAPSQSSGAGLPASPVAQPPAAAPARPMPKSSSPSPIGGPQTHRPAAAPARPMRESSGSGLTGSAQTHRPAAASVRTIRESSGRPLDVEPASKTEAPAKRSADAPEENADMAAPRAQPANTEPVEKTKATARSRAAAASQDPATENGARAPAPLAAEAESRSISAGDNELEAEALVRAARKHMTARRFAAAAAAYEVLLRRFPEDARATEWRRQLRLAGRAAAIKTEP
jgi:hypothetical protein